MEEFMPMATEFAKNHSLLVIAWVAAFIMTIYVFIKSAISKVKIIDNNQATMLINRENGVIVDLRPIDEFKRGHIIHSLNILPAEIKNKNIGKLDHQKDKPVIVVCAAGMTSTSSAEELSKQGFNQVYALKDGISGWNNANLPLVKH